MSDELPRDPLYDEGPGEEAQELVEATDEQTTPGDCPAETDELERPSDSASQDAAEEAPPHDEHDVTVEAAEPNAEEAPTAEEEPSEAERFVRQTIEAGDQAFLAAVNAAAAETAEPATEEPAEEVPLARRWDEFLLALSAPTRDAVWEGGFSSLDDLTGRTKEDVTFPRGPFSPPQADEVEAWLLAHGGKFRPSLAELRQLRRRVTVTGDGTGSVRELDLTPEERAARQLRILAMAKNGVLAARQLSRQLEG